MLRGGKIDPALDGAPRDSILIEGDRIAWIGEARDAPRAGKAIDLHGSRTVAGLTDAHLHLFMRAQELLNLGLGPATASIPALLECVRSACAATAPGQWVMSADYSEQFLAERRHPTRTELDAVSQGNPVLLRRTGGHLSVANSAALALAGFDINTPDPPGGTIERAHGELTGVLTENAADIVAALIPPPSPAQTIEAIRKVAAECLSLGIVAAVEAAVGFNNGFGVEWNIWQALKDAGGLPLRMGFMLRIDPAEARRLNLRPTGHDDHWQVRTLKFFVDGIIGARTAAFSEPYADRDTKGFLMEEAADLRAKAVEAHVLGWQLAAHVIGDRAIAHWLDCLEAAAEAAPSPERHRLEHFAVPGRDALARVHRLGAIVVPQYGFLHRLGNSFASAIGPDRAQRLYPGRSVKRAGVTIAGSSDHPIGPLSPYPAIAAAINRTTSAGLVLNPEEGLPVREALAAYTQGGAFAMGHELRRGQLQAGMLADIAVLDRDILMVDPAELAETRSRLTVVGGKIAYSDGTLAA
ncbi:amidohydrolase [Bradyrhizobium lablabi]|uniref:amidohydrolase n=1 Tax=Bradyrhizobium lablabi TaxID=722472 RepID=UPI001BAAC827|nr:amidohydrolase [Bradyrhizobium lablabi]MBR1125154.1 amidohydrolase [Bradyrhizobium lablabi]